ncbi:MAG TPA: PHP-associated domain-containing protein [Streptosporangiaceae bacterium]|nr:PHP-associated domain-containing protein [Streptosporangiaceae bacterium]
MLRVDCHLHTVASGDAITTLDQLADRAAAERIDVVCITDHNETAAALAAAASGLRGVRVIVGEEVRTRAGEVIGLFLTERIPYVLPVADAVARIRAQGGLVYLPHPYDAARGSVGAAADRLCADGMADVIEVFNTKIADQDLNARAADLAARWRLPGAAGSDAHDPAGIGAAYVEMPDFDGPASFLAALANARVAGEYRGHAPPFPRPGTAQSGSQGDHAARL